MGGILSAEVVLLKKPNDESFQHRILGTVNFDTPFLGMHPGVVVSGIGSIFRAAPESPGANSQQGSSQGTEAVRIPTNENVSSSSYGTPALQQPRTQSSTTSGYFSPPSSSATTSRQGSGLTSLQQASSLDLPTKDPNYNPPFPNDIRLPTRTGWDNALHFVMKHSDGLTKATKSYVTSHLEFGGAMADYKGLQNRYGKLRALEDVEASRSGRPRIRFVNYYTASTGRSKRPKSLSPGGSRSQIVSQVDGSGNSVNESMQELALAAPSTRSPSRSPRISVEEYRDGQVIPGVLEDDEDLDAHQSPLVDESANDDASEGMNTIDPTPITDDEHEEVRTTEDKSASETMEPTSSSTSHPNPLSPSPSLPPIPTLPPSPPAFNPTPYPDKDTRKIAEKEHSRQVKAYKQAVKDRDKAIKDRRKLLEKREKAAKLAREKQMKLKAKELVKAEKDAEIEEGKKKGKDGTDTTKPTSQQPKKLQKESTGADGAAEQEPPKPKRDRKFCLLPPKTNNERDPCWMRVYMRDVDEVGAHCGLFVVGEQYEWLVGDVGERVRGWVVGA